MTVYTLSQEYKALIELAADTEDESALKTLFDSLNDNINDKFDSIAVVINELENDSEKITNEIKRLQGRKKTIDNNVTSVKKLIFDFMKFNGIVKQKTTLHTIIIAKNPKKLVMLDSFLVPTEYKKEVTETVVDTDLIRKELDAGAILDFAEYQQSERLSIK